MTRAATYPDPFEIAQEIARKVYPSLDEDNRAEAARTGIVGVDLIEPTPAGVERAASIRMMGGLNAVRMSAPFLALLGARVALSRGGLGGDVYCRLHAECLSQASRTLNEFGADESALPPVEAVVLRLLDAYAPGAGVSLFAA